MPRIATWSASLALSALIGLAGPASAAPTYKGQPVSHLLSSGGYAAWVARQRAQSPGSFQLVLPGLDDDNPFIDPNGPLVDFPALADEGGVPGVSNGRGHNVFASDPCSDPPPPRRDRTVQSETELAVLNSHGSHGKKIVVGFNDSEGFYDNRLGLSGFAYSIDGGKHFIDGGGLPPVIPDGSLFGTPGSDHYAGDPVLVVHNATETFYYASIYITPNGFQTLAVNRGHFMRAPPQGQESRSNTRCADNPAAFGIPDPPPAEQERIIWEKPVVAVSEAELGGVGPSPDPSVADALDKEWLYVDQRTGELYLTYTRFGFDGSTPLELVRSFDMGRTWTPPTVIVPNLIDTFNQATQPVVTRTGRVVVTWFARTFALVSPFGEISDRIESAYSDDDGVTFSVPVTVSPVNPQGEPLGYNRRRPTILNAPYIITDRFGHGDDQSDEENGDSDDRDDGSGVGNVYITYFDGLTPLGTPPAKAANIKLSVSRTNGATWDPPAKVNSDDGTTTHVFPSVQVNRTHQVFVAWTDRRVDPKNVLNDVWAASSSNLGRTVGENVRVTDVSTSWYQRADARPNFGDYNSSELLDFERFVTTWADGRFPPGTYIPPSCTPRPPPGQTCPPTLAGTPDTLFAKVPGLSDPDRGDESD